MKPTAEMIERARILLVVMGLFDPSETWENVIAQALADEHERALAEPCACCRDRGCSDGCQCESAAIRAAAKGELTGMILR